MFVLVDYNKNYSDVCENIEKRGYSPVTVFKFTLNSRKEIAEQFEKIKELKNRINPKYSAVEVRVEWMDNSSVGYVNSLKKDFDIVIGLGGLNKVNRFFLEDTNVDFLRDPHNVIFRNKMDFIHHFNSGINHVLTNLARDRRIGMLFSLNFVLGKEKNIAKEFGRISQNIKFCEKGKVDVLLNFVVSNVNQIKSCDELKKIATLFGMSSQMATKNCNVLENKLKDNHFRLSDKFVCDGIYFK